MSGGGREEGCSVSTCHCATLRIPPHLHALMLACLFFTICLPLSSPPLLCRGPLRVEVVAPEEARNRVVFSAQPERTAAAESDEEDMQDEVAEEEDAAFSAALQFKQSRLQATRDKLQQQQAAKQKGAKGKSTVGGAARKGTVGSLRPMSLGAFAAASSAAAAAAAAVPSAAAAGGAGKSRVSLYANRGDAYQGAARIKAIKSRK